MANPVDSLLRWWGLCFLIVAVGMLIWGQTLLKPHLFGVGFLLYWAACLGFTLLALGAALLDTRATRLRLRQEQHDLIHRAIEGLERADRPPRRSSPNGGGKRPGGRTPGSQAASRTDLSGPSRQ